MKALYTIIDDTLYQVDQRMHIPENMVRLFRDHNTLSTNTDNHQISVQIWMNNFNRENQKSNKEIYDNIISSLKENLITEIDKVQNFFKMTIDYTLYGQNGKEIDHSITVQPIKPIDSFVPLGINQENECVYRFIKVFRKKLGLRFKDSVPYGIMTKKTNQYMIIINSINIYQDENPYEEMHGSFEGKSFRPNSHTINSNLEHMKLVYSSKMSRKQFEPIVLPFIPKVVNFDFEIMLDNYFIAYDENDINKILTENIFIKNGQEGEDIPEKPECPPHRPPHHREWIYFRSISGKPNTLLVVEDMYPDSLFNPRTMVRKKDVIFDIPNIEVGEYVTRRKVEVHHPHHPPFKPHRPPHHRPDDICHRKDYKEFNEDYIISLFEDPEDDDYLSDNDTSSYDEDYEYEYVDEGYGE